MPVCLSVHPYGITWLSLDRFSVNLVFAYFLKICHKIQVSLKSDKNNVTLLGDQNAFFIISHSLLLRIRNVLDKFVEKIKTQFYLQ